MNWTQPQDLRKQLLQFWDKGAILAGLIDGAPVFPLRFALKTPTSRELSERFEEVRQWIAALRQMGGFRLEMKEIRHRVLGENTVPAAAWLDSSEEAIKILGKQKEVRQFAHLVSTTQSRNPALIDWIAKYPLKALALAGEWAKLLDIIDWLKANPRPAIYLRQVDIPGVDTKFIESRRGVLMPLLDLSLPAGSINEEARGASQFTPRYGFREKPVRVRFRILDASVRLLPGSNQDITVTQDTFRALDTEVRFKAHIRRIFITENETNFLTFPETSASIVLFGAGYGFENLSDVGWLSNAEVYYWGDIDTHGFAILDQLRARLPHARSLLMDEQTLLAHKPFWEEENKPERRALARLTPMEQQLYDALRNNSFSNNLRLEQERVGFTWILNALRQSC